MFHRTKYYYVAQLLLLSIILIAPLSASMVYSDRVDWEAETLAATTIGFEGITDTYQTFSTAAGLTIGDVQFIGSTGSGNDLVVVNPISDPTYDFGSGSILKGPFYFSTDTSRMITIILPGDTTSFGLDLMTVGSSPEDYTVTLSTAEEWTSITTVAGGTQFFGVTTEVPFTQVHLILTSGINVTTYPVIDNVSYGTAGVESGLEETPEVATLLMVGTGLLLVWRYGRRRVSAPAT